MLVFINPGHDIDYDPGAVNQEMCLEEATVALEVGQLVSKYLEDVGYDTIVYQYDSLAAICDEANECEADIFVSIHCNAAESQQANGTETFVYKRGGHSEVLANCIQEQLIDTLNTTDRGVKEANFYVVKNTEMPAVLVELAFITNEQDAVLLRDRQDDIARAIARGVTDYSARISQYFN